MRILVSMHLSSSSISSSGSFAWHIVALVAHEAKSLLQIGFTPRCIEIFQREDDLEHNGQAMSHASYTMYNLF